MDYFELAFALRPGQTELEKNAFWDDFVAEVERHGLVIGGGGAESVECIVSCGANSRVTVRHRSAVIDWLNSHSDVIAVHAGPFQKDPVEVTPG